MAMKDLTHGIHFDVFSSFRSNVDKKPRWYWRLVAGNGKIIADGSEAYASRSNAVRAVRAFQKRCLFIESFRIISID